MLLIDSSRRGWQRSSHLRKWASKRLLCKLTHTVAISPVITRIAQEQANAVPPFLHGSMRTRPRLVVYVQGRLDRSEDFIKRAVEKLNSGQNEGCDTPLSKPANDGEPHLVEQSSRAQ